MRTAIRTGLFTVVILVLCYGLSGCFGFRQSNAKRALLHVTRGYGRAVVVDSNGNTYVTGEFNYTVDFDPGPGVDKHTSLRGNDAYLSKFDPTGEFIWAINWGGTSVAGGNGVAVDSNGNIFVSGEIWGTTDLDPGPGVDEHPVPKEVLMHIFLSKFDPDGNFIWGRSWGAAEPAYGNGVAADANGNVYVTGAYRDTVDFDPGPGVDQHTTKGLKDIFLSKFDSNGNFIWVRTLGAARFADSHGVAIDLNGNACVTGNFSMSIDFDPGLEAIKTNGEYDVYIGKFDSEGNFIWGRTFGGADDDHGNSVAFDPNGNVYIAGRFSGTVDLDPGAGVDEHTSEGGTDIFLSRLDPDGNFLWACTWGGSTSDHSREVTVDSDGNAYIAGRFSGTVDFDPGSGVNEHTSDDEFDAFLSKFDSTGSLLWAINLGGARYSEGDGVAVDGSGNPYITGRFDGTLDFDPGPGVDEHTVAGSQDIFLCKFDSNGSFLWARTWGATPHDRK